MKIALLSVFYPFRGGIAQFGAMLYRALEEHHEVKAYTFSRQYPNLLFPGSSQFVTKEDKADEIPAEQLLDSINPLTFRSTAKAINAFDPEVVISQYWMPFLGPALGGVQKRIQRSTTQIAILHNVIPHEKRFFDAAANNFFLKQNKGFVVLSDAVLKDLLTLKPDAKYLRIDHPVYSQFGARMERDEALKTIGLPPEHNYLLFFGFIRDYKGLDLMLNALELLDDNFHLIVAGECYGSFDSYQNIIHEKGLGDRVHLYTQYISDDEVTRYFSAADVCVLPYKSATQSGITAIAHHFELPIIATDVGGLKEKIKHESTGLIVDQPEKEAFASAVKRYFEECDTETMRNNISNDNAQNTWEQFSEKIIAFARDL